MKPIAHKMTLLRCNLGSKLEAYVPVKLSVILTVIFCIENPLLHALATFFCHRFAILRIFTPKFSQLQRTIDEKSQPSCPGPRSVSQMNLSNLALASVPLGAQIIGSNSSVSQKIVPEPSENLKMPTKCTSYSDVTSKADESQG